MRKRVVERSPNGRATRWLAIAAALREGVKHGRFAPDEALPSTRELAHSYGVHRHTIMVALDALAAEGLLRAEQRRGYFVCPDLPGLAPPSAAELAAFGGFRLVRGAQQSRPTRAAPSIPLHAATPDPGLLPLAELRAAYAHVLGKRGGAVFASTDEHGRPALQRELVRYVRRARGFVPRDLLITHGSQGAIALVAQALLRAGDVVLIEEPRYESAADVFRELGTRLVPVPVDRQGLRVEVLAKLLARHKARLLYTTPNHQYPTTVTLSAPRRALLLQLTSQHGVPVLEDDYDHEYHYRGTAQPPLAAAKNARHVVYVGTLSKLVSPGLRIGFSCGEPALLDALRQLQHVATRGSDAVTQAAIADWMADGGLDRHLRRTRRVYAARRDAAVEALAAAARQVHIEYEAPDGGLAVWTVWPEHDVTRLAERAAERGVSVLPESRTSAHRRGHGIRLGFGAVSAAQFAQGLDVLVQEARRLAQRPGGRGAAARD